MSNDIDTVLGTNDSLEARRIVDEEARLNVELEIVRNMRQAFTAALQMLEAARDDLIEMGLRMDRLQQASVQCRTAWQEQTTTTTTTRPKNEKRQDLVGAP